MQRLGDTLRAMNKDSALNFALVEARVFSVWEDVVGRAVKENTDLQRIKNGILFVKTKNPSWAHELKALSTSIKNKINEAVGANVVREIRFLHGSGPAREANVEDKDNPLPELDLIKLSSEELRQIDGLVCDIKQDDLKQRLTEILTKDKKLNKWRNIKQRY